MKQKRSLTMNTREAVTGYLFIGLFVAGMLFLFIPAVIQSFLLSLQNTDDVFAPFFVGLTNYKWALAVDPEYIREIVNTMLSLISDVAVICFFSLFISTLLNKNIRGKGIFRALLFLPVVVSTGVIARYIDFSASADTGILGSGVSVVGEVFSVANLSAFFASFSISGSLTDIILNAISNIYGVISRSGVQIVIFLAGLQAISPSIYEAATVEGCTSWEGFWKITLPMISPIITVCCVYTVIDSFSGKDNVVMRRILDMITGSMEYGRATAMTFVYFALVSIVLTACVWLLNKVTYYE